MKEKVGNRQHLLEKTEVGTFSCLFQIFGFTWPHLPVHFIIPKGKWSITYIAHFF